MSYLRLPPRTSGIANRKDARTRKRIFDRLGSNVTILPHFDCHALVIVTELSLLLSYRGSGKVSANAKNAQLMKTQFVAQLMGAIAFPPLGLAGGMAVPSAAMEKAASPTGDWCQSIKDMGKIYADADNHVIQKVTLFGRVHYQWGYTDGDIDGNDFSGNGDELRRLRPGVEINLLNHFTFLGSMNFSDGGFRHHRVRDADWNDLYLTYRAGDQMGVEDLKLSYGLYKVGFGQEEYETSNRIKTIERSLLNNLIPNRRSTGVRATFRYQDTDVLIGVYTSDGSGDPLGSWDAGTGYQLRLAFNVFDGELALQGLYHDCDPGTVEPTFIHDWAVSASYTRDFGNWNVQLDTSYIDFPDGDVYGFVLIPSTFLIEDRLEAVFRLQWIHSTGNQLRPQSRNVLNVASLDGYRIPFGDDYQNVYAGLNYYFCGDNLKLMTGVEFDRVESESEVSYGTTFWTALRFYF